ncbi:unnamed protein product [Linum trigynum]|uniref:RNase H type-1 domain-containing protein n=1 Tax=Linum trigynum TaxID=586398 RepID=A0AAV2FRU5_9ROSI
MRFVSLLWRVWKSHNWVVFEGCQYQREVLRNQWVTPVEEWKRMRSVEEDRHQGRRQVAPLAPLRFPQGVSWVCSFDGAVREASHSAVGIVLQGPYGVVVRALGKGLADLTDPMLVELMAIREAILWCRSMGLHDVCYQGDAKVVIDKLLAGCAWDCYGGAVLREVQELLANVTGDVLRFVGRDNNRVAHRVARKALSLYPTLIGGFDFCVWLHS